MQRERFADVLEIDELRDLAVRIAGDVHHGAVPARLGVEPVDRHDREQLSERPMIEKRLENGEVADVLIA